MKRRASPPKFVNLEVPHTLNLLHLIPDSQQRSLRRVFQELSARQEELRQRKKRGEDVGSWLKSLVAFAARLRWRSHFSQKLNDQPSIEHI